MDMILIAGQLQRAVPVLRPGVRRPDRVAERVQLPRPGGQAGDYIVISRQKRSPEGRLNKGGRYELLRHHPSLEEPSACLRAVPAAVRRRTGPGTPSGPEGGPFITEYRMYT